MMKLRIVCIFAFIGLFFFSSAHAAHRQYLNDGWTFGQARATNRYPATVPGVVHTDLLAHNLIEDPYFGLNERAVQWVDKEDWIYESSFRVDDKVMSKDNVTIVFEGLDTYADVYLNDVLIIKADNMFRTWKADVKQILKTGDNHIKVYFSSPIKIDMPKWEKTPYVYSASNDQSENGGVFDRKLSVFARKAGYHYGWDWGPRLVTSGIWRDVYLDAWSGATITDAYFYQNKVNSKRAEISDILMIDSENDCEGVTVSVTDQDTGERLAVKRVDLRQGANKVTIDFSIKNPRLWWCNGLGKPELYVFATTIEKDGEVMAASQRRVGLRDVKVVTDPDEHGDMQFYFVLNGIPVFAKGTNYIPQDNFLTSVSGERYRTTIEDAVNANMNMIRIWGGGIYENEIFYDLCDEMGIMVWQDFMFACSVYPADGEWLENMIQEAVENVSRLRNHPSVVIWCGGNECPDAWYNWGWKNKLMESNPDAAAKVEMELNRQYYEVLPAIVKEYAPGSFYWPASPYAFKGKGSDGVNGDRHYWSVWHRKMPISTYNKDVAHFFSEYGMQSFPEYNTVLKFAPDTAVHFIGSDVMMSHQRGGDFANQLIRSYLDSEYVCPKDFKDFLYATQVMQGDAMRTAIEAHRRNMPYCMGSLLWQHNDCWPVASWSTRDYYANWKAAHYMVKKAFENLLVSADIENDSINVFTVSDYQKIIRGKVDVSVSTFDGETVFNKSFGVVVKPNTSACVWKESLRTLLNGHSPSEVFVNLSLSSGAHSHQGNYFLCNQKDLNLRNASFDVDIIPTEGDGYQVRLRSDTFVRALFLSLDGVFTHFSDNFFDLIPGETKTVSVNSDLGVEEFRDRLILTTFNNINE